MQPAAIGLSVDHSVVQAFVKVGGMVNSHPDFINHPKVMNGVCNDVMTAVKNAVCISRIL
jgi:hypothetical protein